MAEYKLYYFDVRSRAEPIRLMLTYAGVKFDDIRISMEEWPSMKQKMPMGQLPVLECVKTGQQLSQTLAIAKFVADAHGLAGKDNWDKARVLMMTAGVIDQWSSLGKVYMQKMAGNAAAEKEAWLSYKADSLKTFLDQYSRMLDESKTGWLVGDSITWADLATGELLSDLQDNFSADALDGCPKMKEYASKVMSQPQLKSYISSRPKTMF